MIGSLLGLTLASTTSILAVTDRTPGIQGAAPYASLSCSPFGQIVGHFVTASCVHFPTNHVFINGI